MPSRGGVRHPGGGRDGGRARRWRVMGQRPLAADWCWPVRRRSRRAGCSRTAPCQGAAGDDGSCAMPASRCRVVRGGGAGHAACRRASAIGAGRGGRWWVVGRWRGLGQVERGCAAGRVRSVMAAGRATGGSLATMRGGTPRRRAAWHRSSRWQASSCTVMGRHGGTGGGRAGRHGGQAGHALPGRTARHASTSSAGRAAGWSCCTGLRLVMRCQGVRLCGQRAARHRRARRAPLAPAWRAPGPARIARPTRAAAAGGGRRAGVDTVTGARRRAPSRAARHPEPGNVAGVEHRRCRAAPSGSVDAMPWRASGRAASWHPADSPAGHGCGGRAVAPRCLPFAPNGTAAPGSLARHRPGQHRAPPGMMRASTMAHGGAPGSRGLHHGDGLTDHDHESKQRPGGTSLPGRFVIEASRRWRVAGEA